MFNKILSSLTDDQVKMVVIFLCLLYQKNKQLHYFIIFIDFSFFVRQMPLTLIA